MLMGTDLLSSSCPRFSHLSLPCKELLPLLSAPGGPSTSRGLIHPHLTHLQSGAGSWLSSRHPPVLQTHLHHQLLCWRGDFAAFSCPGCPFPNAA